MRNSVVTSAAAAPILSLAEAKAQLNVETAFTDDDTLIATYVSAASAWLENRCGRSFITQTRKQYMDCFPKGDTLELLYPPVQSITSVEYYDESDAVQTFSSGSYWFDANALVPRIVVKNTWPGTIERPNAVIVTYVCGYGAASTSVPEPIKIACRLLLTQYYENRSADLNDQVMDAVEGLISMYVVSQFTGE